MKPLLFEGCATALATPFSAQGIDLPALRRLVKIQIQAGVKALVACGTTGEPSTMSAEEWALTVQTVVDEAAGKVKVIAGTGGNNTAHVLAQAKQAKALGADAQLCVTPYYNKTTQAGLVAHYRAIADAGDLPVIIYNVPGRTGLSIAPETLAQLAPHNQIIAIKEASADLIKVADMIRLCGDQIAYYSGSDEVVVPLMALGGQGVISVLSNIAPAETCQMTDYMLAGKTKEAAKLQLKLMPLIHALFSEVNPIPLKAALHLMGICENLLRLPLVPLSQGNSAVLKAEMLKLGFI